MKARGRVWKHGDTWFYAVGDSQGKVVLEDNAGDFALIIKECNRSVYGVQRIEIAGHALEYSYTEIVRHRMDEIPAKIRNQRHKWL